MTLYLFISAQSIFSRQIFNFSSKISSFSAIIPFSPQKSFFFAKIPPFPHENPSYSSENYFSRKNPSFSPQKSLFSWKIPNFITKIPFILWKSLFFFPTQKSLDPFSNGKNSISHFSDFILFVRQKDSKMLPSMHLSYYCWHSNMSLVFFSSIFIDVYTKKAIKLIHT